MIESIVHVGRQPGELVHEPAQHLHAIRGLCTTSGWNWHAPDCDGSSFSSTADRSIRGVVAVATNPFGRLHHSVEVAPSTTSLLDRLAAQQLRRTDR